jgi:hypothetical protein
VEAHHRVEDPDVGGEPPAVTGHRCPQGTGSEEKGQSEGNECPTVNA